MKLRKLITSTCVATGIALLGTGCVNVVGLANVALKAGVVKLAFSCLPEGTEIDTPDGPRAIESIQPGEEVIGYSGAPVLVMQSHAYAEDPAAERFYRIEFSNGASVDLCDKHRIAGVRAQDLAPGAEVAGLTVRSSTRYGGVQRSYDLLTTDSGYQIGGVPVNSMIDEMVETAARGRPLPR